jgi:putative nucleotidyltransferase with HDIG domain
MIVLSFMLYLSLFRKDFLLNARNVLLLFSLMAIFPVITSFFLKEGYTDLYLIPYAMIPIFSRVFMDSRTAFMLHVCTILICARMTDSSYDFFVIELIAGLTAIYALSELSQRSHIFRSSVAVTVSSILTYCSIELMIGNQIDAQNLQHIYSFVINGVLLLFAYPFMFLLEKMFGFTSNVTLVELSNTNNPLLRKMSEEAPGTFQHSMQVANLAAEAAVRVGAKSQLVRTGALYHDIGKIRKSIFFTENQSKINPHESLPYEESARIIIEHVTEGVKLAEKYNLPKVIRDFIATHHGTGKAKYFYIKYKNEHQDEEVDESLFTYPGPNPFTPEQAILMMADSVEAASRSLQDYTTESISELVDRIIDGQVNDGYFRECPITFRDISTIKEVFKEKLRTIYHTRIQYPDEAKAKTTPRLEVLPTADPHRSSTPVR